MPAGPLSITASGGLDAGGWAVIGDSAGPPVGKAGATSEGDEGSGGKSVDLDTCAPEPG